MNPFMSALLSSAGSMAGKSLMNYGGNLLKDYISGRNSDPKNINSYSPLIAQSRGLPIDNTIGADNNPVSSNLQLGNLYGDTRRDWNTAYNNNNEELDPETLEELSMLLSSGLGGMF